MTRARSAVGLRGFTLLEVIVALTVTALALGTAGFAVGAARSTATRIETHTEGTEADGRMRTLLTDMLRHAPAAEQTDGALLTIDRGADSPVLRFVTTGVREPFGTSGPWKVEVALRDSVLTLRAEPMSRNAADQSLVASLDHVSGFEVRVLEHGSANDAARWRTDWPVAQDRPRAIELSWSHMGSPAITPLRVLLAPLEVAR